MLLGHKIGQGHSDGQEKVTPRIIQSSEKLELEASARSCNFFTL